MMNLAIKEANRSECRCQHGAVIARGKRVFGSGHNNYKPHPTYGGGPLKTLHAEAAAIRDAVRKGVTLKGATLYVTRQGNENQMSRPCESCQELIGRHGIKKVVYTDSEGNLVTEWPL